MTVAAAIFEDMIADLDTHDNVSHFLINNYRDGVVPICGDMARHCTLLALTKRFQVVCEDVTDKLSFMQMPQSLKLEYADRILAKLPSPTVYPPPLAKIPPSMTTLPIISMMPRAMPHFLTTPPRRPAPLAVAELDSAWEDRYNAAQARIVELEGRLQKLESTNVDTPTRMFL